MKNDTISMITEYLKNIFYKKLGRSGVEDLNHKQVLFEIYKNNKNYSEFINGIYEELIYEYKIINKLKIIYFRCKK